MTAVDDGVVMLRVSVLRLVELLSHHVVQRPAPEEENLLERFPEVPVQGGVDDGVEEGIGVAQPEEEAGERRGDGGRVATQEGPDQRQDEEGQPADGEGAHDDAQSGGGLALLGQGEPQLLVVGQSQAGRSRGLAAGFAPRQLGDTPLPGAVLVEDRALRLVGASRRGRRRETARTAAALQHTRHGWNSR